MDVNQRFPSITKIVEGEESDDERVIPQQKSSTAGIQSLLKDAFDSE